MFSLQRTLGRPKLFFGLLNRIAGYGVEAVGCLQQYVTSASAPDMEVVRSVRRKDKQACNELEELLLKVFVTPIEREDLEAVASDLYRLPKAAEKFAEIYSIGWSRVKDGDFESLLKMLSKSAKIVTEMVDCLASNGKMAEIKALDARLSQIGADSSDITNNALRRRQVPGADPLTEIIVHDLYRNLTNCLDICRSSGRTLALVTLKNS
jgi:uncharacterized protein